MPPDPAPASITNACCLLAIGKFPLLFLLLLTTPLAAADDDHDDAPVSFRAEIAPILLEQCQACHGPREAGGQYRLDTFERLMAPDADPPIVAPGDPEESELYLLLTDPEPDFRMPADADPLPEQQIELIRRWIAEGAEYDADDPDQPLARIIPAPTHPDPPKHYSVPPPIAALAFSPDGSAIAASGYHEVTVWEVETGELLRRIGNAPRRIHSLAWSGDGGTLAVAGGVPGESGEVRLFSPEDGELIAVPVQTDELVLSVAFGPDDRELAVGGADNVIRIVDVETGVERLELFDHSDWVMAVRFDEAGERLASASRDQTAKIFDADTGATITTWREHDGQVFDIGFRGEEHVATVGADRRLAVWEADDGDSVGTGRIAGEPLQRLITHDDYAFTASADGRVRLHELPGRDHVRTYDAGGETDWLFSLAFHSETGHLAAGSHDGHITIWHYEDDEPLLHFLAAPQSN